MSISPGFYCGGVCSRTDRHEHHNYDDQVEFRKGTCEVCNRDRKLARWSTYYWRCRECYPLEVGTNDYKVARAAGDSHRQQKNSKQRMKYPIVGGPRDGQHAHDREAGEGYKAFNRAGGRGIKRRGGLATMIFVWDPDDELRNR